ncbi:MAG: L,D-transpeptidase [Verrucomicrobiales bacterium]|nr:L,D-transpeptidase [Verrucomicrobiales bacterium]
MKSSHFLKLLAIALLAPSLLFISACETLPTHQAKLKPGQFEWHPERSPSGPLLIVISVDDQIAYVYRNGINIARSTVSTGKSGHDTPTGVFTILQRHVDHESSIYKGAKMPYMQRLTWGGIAMHAGNLPGYPASHGCVRLPYEFSKKLFTVTQNGSTVVITNKAAKPSRSSQPASLLLASRSKPGSAPAIPNPDRKATWNPGKSPSGPVSILVSYQDATAYIYRNGIQIGQSPIGINGPANLPEGVFMMLEGQTSPPNWTVLSLHGGKASRNAVGEMRGRIHISDDFRNKVISVMTPGTILLATSQSSTAATRSSRDFSIMKPEAPKSQ